MDYCEQVIRRLEQEGLDFGDGQEPAVVIERAEESLPDLFAEGEATP